MVYEEFGGPPLKAHRADTDIIMTNYIYRKMVLEQ